MSKKLKKLTNAILAILVTGSLLLTSCKKDDKDNAPVKLTEEQIEACVEEASTISTELQSIMTLSLSEAAEAGYDTDEVPDVSMKKSGSASNELAYGDYTWSGPDAQGWYTRSTTGVYKYSEKVRYRDTIDYILTIEYSSADGSYKNETTTKYIKYTKNGKTLYKGFSRWEVHASGYNDMSRFEWKITFEDWNPLSGAGVFDWFWGVSENSGGDVIPMYRFEHMETTEAQDGWLNVRTIWYDEDGSEIWDFEYETPWEPVVMPDVPELE